MPRNCCPAVVIAGPTASGKSALALALAREFNGEIVSCDALQVYQGMDIGTAKPGRLERDSIPHHMIDLRAPFEDFSAGDYQRLGREVLKNIQARGRIPFVSGGTGFYLRALIQGLFEGPGRSEPLRERMKRIAGRRGPATLHRALARVDHVSATRIAPADVARVMRAYEVYLLTGRTMSRWQRQQTSRLEGFCWLKLGIEWPRETLYRRIEARVDQMLEMGLVDEVRGLLQRFPEDSHAFKAIGYRQIIECLNGKMTLAQAIEETKRQSRRYAKRQLTWFRSDREVLWLHAARGEEDLLGEARRRVEELLAAQPDEARHGEER